MFLCAFPQKGTRFLFWVHVFELLAGPPCVYLCVRMCTCTFFFCDKGRISTFLTLRKLSQSCETSRFNPKNKKFHNILDCTVLLPTFFPAYQFRGFPLLFLQTPTRRPPSWSLFWGHVWDPHPGPPLPKHTPIPNTNSLLQFIFFAPPHFTRVRFRSIPPGIPTPPQQGGTGILETPGGWWWWWVRADHAPYPGGPAFLRSLKPTKAFQWYAVKVPSLQLRGAAHRIRLLGGAVREKPAGEVDPPPQPPQAGVQPISNGGSKLFFLI